jgi:hypothetical protein
MMAATAMLVASQAARVVAAVHVDVGPAPFELNRILADPRPDLWIMIPSRLVAFAATPVIAVALLSCPVICLQHPLDQCPCISARHARQLPAGRYGGHSLLYLPEQCAFFGVELPTQREPGGDDQASRSERS